MSDALGAEAATSVDLSGLISFNPTVLELSLRGILVRLSNLEKSNHAAPNAADVASPKDTEVPAAKGDAQVPAALAAQLDALRDRVRDLESRDPASNRDPNRSAADPALLDRIKALENEVANRGTPATPRDSARDEGRIYQDIPANLSHRLARLEDALLGAVKDSDGTADLKRALEDQKSKVEGVEARQKQILDEQDDLAKKVADLAAGRARDEDALKQLEDALKDVQQAQVRGTRGLSDLKNDLAKLAASTPTSDSPTQKDDTPRETSAPTGISNDQLEDLRRELDQLMNGLADSEKARKNDARELEGVKRRLADDIDGISRKLKGLEADVARIDQDVQGLSSKGAVDQLDRKVDSLEKRLEDLSRQPVAISAPSTIGKSEANTQETASAVAPQIDDLRKLLMALQNSFDAFRSEARQTLKTLRDDVDGHKKEINALGTESSRLSGDMTKRVAEIKKLDDVKANKADIDQLRALLQAVKDDGSIQGIKDQMLDLVGRVGDHARHISDFRSALQGLQSTVTSLSNEKAGKDLVGHLSVDVAELGAAVKQLELTKPSVQRSQVSDETVSALQSAINDAMTTVAQDRDWTKGQLVEIRATVEHIHHSKADASLVANKAERDYVENAMEKLMREVEQVLNSTNSGLIDTIDKSLNILRDMIDGKATKEDVAALKKGIHETGEGNGENGNVPDGLMGYKGYRCLGCNRTMEGMRSRPIGSSFSAFLNRVPASPRVPRPPTLASPATQTPVIASNAPAGYITGPPGSA